MDRDFLFGRLGSWIRWSYGEVGGRAFVAVTAPAHLPATLEPWAVQHQDAVWQLIWLDGNAVLCGLASTAGPEQFAVVQHTSEGSTTESVVAYRPDGSWRQIA
jgi:hypothetical protein